MKKFQAAFFAAFIAAISIFSQAQAQSGLVSFEKGELTIRTQAGDTHRFDVELAENPRQHAQGLMFRQHMAGDAGMLFIYPSLSERAMWMKNTFIPLDMLFLDSGGEIVHLVERTVPQSLTSISSKVPVLAVLELNGGTVSRLGLAVGDRVEHSAFAAPN